MTSRAWLRSLVLVVGMAGCSQGLQRAFEAGAGDGGDCGCAVVNDTLTVSWACYCEKWGCTQVMSACEGFRNRMTYPACGLITETINTAGGPWVSVWDSSGKLVGSQSVSDTSPYVCPSDPSLTAFQVRAGEFPATRCEPTACTCDADGGATCGVVDAGALACDGSPPPCPFGSPGERCDDTGKLAVCVSGGWSCPSGTVPISQCACIGSPPTGGCSCGAGGSWICPDAGTGN